MAKNRHSSTTRDTVSSYKVTRSGGHVDVEVTSGQFVGKTARVIPVSPSGAYFNLPKEVPKKRA